MHFLCTAPCSWIDVIRVIAFQLNFVASQAKKVATNRLGRTFCIYKLRVFHLHRNDPNRLLLETVHNAISFRLHTILNERRQISLLAH